MDTIRDAVRLALHEAGSQNATYISRTENVRQYACEVPGCGRSAYAKGLCNAHYLRKRQGRDLGAPIANRGFGRTCSECEKPIGGKGGLGRCATHYRRHRYNIIKGTLVEVMGGACSACGGKFPLAVYDFHHTSDKQDSIAGMLLTSSIDAIAKEVAKCVLLCANCHRMEHANDPG